MGEKYNDRRRILDESVIERVRVGAVAGDIRPEQENDLVSHRKDFG